jgi:hypothetical protein
VGSKLFSDLVGVAPVGARSVVGEDDTRTVLQLVEDLQQLVIERELTRARLRIAGSPKETGERLIGL